MVSGPLAGGPGVERRRLLAAAAGLALAGCARGAGRSSWPPIAFDAGPPLSLAVAGIRFEEAPAAPAEGPAEDGERDLRFAMPLSPADTMRRWAAERLRAAGGAGSARVVLEENRFVAVPLETASGLEGLFAIDRSERYRGALALRVEIVDDPAGTGFARAAAHASRSVAENDSLARRDEILCELLRTVAQTLAERLEREMRDHLAAWIAAG